MQTQTAQLYDKDRSAEFYDERYRHGYMDDWPAERKRRLIEIFRDLPLPPRGVALDFGCGNGVLTEVMRHALPNWQIVGTDLSATAVGNARRRYPNCEFVEAEALDRTFDFVFTHHVLEHVFDLGAVMREITARLNTDGTMLHILPCGNEGSFEREVCLLRRDGIDEDLGGRFFFEDEGHVRRLRSEELRGLCASHGFELSHGFFANQHDGAIEWITSASPEFVRAFADPAQGVDAAAERELRHLRWRLLAIAALRLPARLLRDFIAHRPRRTASKLLVIVAGAPLLPVSFVVDRAWKRRAEREWRASKTDPAGSAMALFFCRSES